ncbi:MAG: alkaline phosphatase family protein [Planctomycetota bacterium]|nr:alkaline phosphatase family protein [Planctomycetota bacterium]
MLKKFLIFSVILGLLVIVPPVVGAEKKSDQPRNIVLVGWDAAQRNHVKECISRNELPNLKKLSDEGAFVEIDIEGTTDTKAGWSQILTGYYPTVTGVYSNGQYQPVPKGLSIFERLEKHFGADKFVTVAVIGKKQHVGEINPPQKIRLDTEVSSTKKKAGDKEVQPGAGTKPVGRIIEENGVKYRLIPGSPYYNMYTALEVWEFGLMEDEKVGTRAIELLEKYKDKPFFFFVHFATVDHQGHKFGENSKEYNDALISNDLWTGKIIEKLKKLGLYDKTLVYVTADHGFDEDKTGHSNAPYVFLATNDKKVMRNGLRQDVAPTILERFGLEFGKLEPVLDGIPLTKPCERGQVKLGRESEYARPKTEGASLLAPVEKTKQAGGQKATQPGQGRFAQRLDGLLEELRKAHQENNKNKVDKLIKQMQELKPPSRGQLAQKFEQWLDELIKAQQENNREKVGQLIKQMQELREQMKQKRAERAKQK